MATTAAKPQPDDEAAMRTQDLLLLVTWRMPFGKYQGVLLADLPGPYLGWFARTGFPEGDLGRLLAIMHEISHNGLRDLLTPLRASVAPRLPQDNP